MTSLRADLPRLVTVSVSAVLCVLGAMLGSGVFGGPPVAEAAGGALAADATLLAPGGPAFAIWSLIYLGLLAYAVWQWLPVARGDGEAATRHRRAGWWIAASMLLNAAWLLFVRSGQLWWSVWVILTLAVVLGVALRLVRSGPPESSAERSLGERLVAETTLGVYLGWVAVATCANVTATLKDAGVDPGGRAAEWVAVAVLVAAVGVVLAVAWFGRGNLALALAAAWGLAWIAVGRLDGEPSSTLVGVAAVVAAVAAVAGTWSVRDGRLKRAAR